MVLAADMVPSTARHRSADGEVPEADHGRAEVATWPGIGTVVAGIILGVRPANESRPYIVTLILIG